MTESIGSPKRALAKNTIILATGKFSSQLIVFLMLPLYTSFLTPSEYGIVDVILTYAVLLAPALTIQMEMATFRFLVEARKSEVEKTRVLSNSLQVIATAIIFLLIIANLLRIFIEIPYFWFVVGIILTTIASGFCLQAARGLGQNVKFAIASIFAGVITVTSNLALIVFLGWGPRGLLTSMILAQAGSAFYLLFSLRLYKYLKFSARDPKLRKELIKYSIPLVPNGISWWGINAADRTIILIFLGLNANGIFAIASKFSLVYSALFSVFGMSWTESASLHINDKNRDRFFSDTFEAAFRFFGSIGIGLLATLPFIFSLFIDDQFKEAYLYIPALVIGAVFNSIVGLYSAVYVAKKMTGKVASTSVMAAIISISLNLILVHFIGLFAASLSNMIAFLSMAIYRHYALKSYVKISYKKSLLTLLILAYSFTLTSYYINNIYLNIFTWFAAVSLFCILNRVVISMLATKLSSQLRARMRGRKG